MSQLPNGMSIGAAVLAYTAAKAPNAFQLGGRPPKISPFPWLHGYLGSIYILNLSPINAKLTALSYVHASKYIRFSANVNRYHSNNGNADVRFGNSSHLSSNFSVPLLLQFASNIEIVIQHYACNNRKLNFVLRCGQ